MQFSDNEIIALLFGTSLSEPGGMYVLLQLVPAVNQKRSATNNGDGKTLTEKGQADPRCLEQEPADLHPGQTAAELDPVSRPFQARIRSLICSNSVGLAYLKSNITVSFRAIHCLVSSCKGVLL